MSHSHEANGTLTCLPFDSANIHPILALAARLCGPVSALFG
jgi:hypothetical protein